MMILVQLILFATTAVIAGLVPTLLFFQTAADRKVFIVGGIATAATTFLIPLLGLPGLVFITVNSLSFFPLWAIALAFPLALVWRLAAAAAPAPPTEEERMETIRRRAMERARSMNRDR